MTDSGIILLLWAGALALMITFSVMSAFSRTKAKKVVFAILAVVAVVPAPIFAHDTYWVPAWMMLALFGISVLVR